AVRDAHGLQRVALAAVRQTPDLPGGRVADGVARSPELGCRAGVERVAHQPAEAAVLDLVRRLAAELEIEAQVVDGPRLVRLHEDAAPGVGDDLAQRCRARLEIDVRHADDRNARRALRAHRAV